MMLSSFRRRGQLAPLDPTEEEPNEFEGNVSSYLSESNIFDHYVSPCEFRVSNDPMLVSANNVCDTTIYGCVRDHSFLIHARDGVIELPVSYDYDLFYKLDSSDYMFDDIVEFLEGSMLEHLASLVDLKQCPPTPTSTGRNRAGNGNNGLRRLETFTEQQKTAFIAVKSGPADIQAIAYGMFLSKAELPQSMLQSVFLPILNVSSRMFDTPRKRNSMPCHGRFLDIVLRGGTGIPGRTNIIGELGRH